MNIRKPFVAVIGAGQVGATTAQRILEKGLSDVVLFDVVEGMPQGKALDLMEAAPVEGHDRRILGTNSYTDIAGAEIVVVTAGLARKPGMTREDLLGMNAKIVTEVCQNVKRYAPEAKLIIVTNPLDVMTHLAQKVTGFPAQRVFGMAGVLDTARMRFFIAEKLGVVPREVEAVVLGGHGDLMVPVSSRTTVQGKPVRSLIAAQDLAAIEQRTRDGGAEIVKLLKTGSAFYAPATSACEMVRAILKDEKKTLPVCARLSGEFGIRDLYFGVPAKVGRAGIEGVVEIPLDESEKNQMNLSAKKVREGIDEIEKLTANEASRVSS